MVKPGYIHRMKVYLAEMFPIPVRLIYSILLYCSFALFLQRIHGVNSSLVSHYTIVGILSVFLVLFILRLMDELKDMDIDRELFKERPLPSGKVFETDITISLALAILFYVAANLLVGKAFWMALIVLVYLLLMFRYFFIPSILRKYLLLNLATHNPIIPISLLYVVSVFATENGIAAARLEWSSILLFIGMYWMISFAWEISRKIRSRDEENAYVTYSQILGRFGAVLIAASAQSLAFGIGLYFYTTLSLSWVFLTIMIVGYAFAIFGHVRFLISPNPRTSKLKPFAERFAILVILANAIEHGFFA